MSESLQPGLSPESSLEDAVRLFKHLTDTALRHTIWTPWRRCGSAQDRTRSATYEREVPTTYSSIAQPKYNDPAWAGPTYALAKIQGIVSRTLTVDHREVVPSRWRWQKQPPNQTSKHQFDIVTRNEQTQIPEFDPPRELTEAEMDALAPYGGGKHRVIFDQQNIPEIRYRVEQTTDDIRILEHRLVGSFVRDFAAIDTIAGLVAANGLLHKELGMSEAE